MVKVAKSLMSKDQRSSLDFVNVKFLSKLKNKIVISMELIRANVMFQWTEEVKSPIIDNSVLKYDREEE